MAESVLTGLDGESVEDFAYVETSIVPGVDFFAHKVTDLPIAHYSCS